MSQMAVAQAQKQVQSPAASSSRVLQRKCDTCRKKKPLLQRAAAGPSPETVPPIVHEVLRSPGQPLDTKTRAFFEERFGHDFGEVRVHADSRAAESARTINAHAYTVGHNLVFGSGLYRPGTMEGRHLLAHELMHTIQQGSALPYVQRLNAIDNESNEGERETASANRGPAGQSASRVAEDDGVGPAEARRALEAHLGRQMLALLEGEAISREGEEEAEQEARRVASGSKAAGTIRRMPSPSMQMLGPGVIVLGAAVAMVLCALGFYNYALDHYSNKSDKWLHCYTSCKIATYCGGQAFSILAGLGKEALDYICDSLGGPCGAEWEDFVADMEGVGCSLQFWRSCVSCCDEARP